MQYICAMCNTKKTTTQEKKYIYASSKKEVKVYVCASCHKAKLLEMETAGEKALGVKITLGVLKNPPENQETQ